MGSPDTSTAERLAELRRRMAAIPARGAMTAGRLPSAAELRREPLPVPSALVGLLPEGGLAKGSVVAYSGATSLLAGLLAAVTGSGGHAAAVGLPRLGLLAAAEMGAQLGKLAVVPDPGPDPVEIAAVLLDGLDLVVLGLGGISVPPSRTRVLAARARSKGATLVVTGGAWTGATLRIDSRIAGYEGLSRGRGRLHTIHLNVSVRTRSTPPRTGRLTLCPRNDRVEWLTPQPNTPPSLEPVGDVAS
ncbi:hypothetical protein NDR87_19115 [Nocardia sp. CDC159]|uniref:Protein ImuA n=1 Tax=Nocardia pulmonis TaxID=2951408 RepID=A0A9X2IYA8_9NOCA|nr:MULTISPECIES: hypothetical protein [Nocardia]MCM6776198.1 hypothetical protein [Nocardia pulmonis]MCM6788476.1 hypothetical protein [Nocardia sp. CDC159]